MIADALARYLAPGPRRGACTRRIDFAGCRPAGARRLRHRALRLPRGEILVRGPRPAAGRDRGRLRVPLPRAAARPRHARHLRQPVRRDRRHPRGAALRARPRAAASSRWSTSRPRPSPARATWRCRSSPAPRSASPRPRPSPASSPCSRRWRSPPPASAAASTPPSEARLAARARRRARPRSPARWRSSREIAEIARDLARARDVLFLGRGADVSAGAGRRAEAEGDQLHPRRRLCVGRAEARADRADRRGGAGDRARALATRSSTRPSRTCRR